MKKKHLSQIIQGKILMAVAGVFAFLMAITMLFFFFFAKDRTINLIHTGLESCDTNAVCSWDKNRDQAVHAWVEYIGEYLKGEGADAVYSAGFTEYLNTIVSQNKSESELSVIGSDGIIVASSNPENAGFDMHSKEGSERILQGMEESDDVYIQDCMESPINGSLMQYSGAPMPDGGYVLSGQSWEVFNQLKTDMLSKSIPFSRIGKEGYLLLTDQDDMIISSPQDQYDGEKLTLKTSPKELAESGEIVRANVFGTYSWVGARVVTDNGVFLVAVYPLREAWNTWIVSTIVLVVIYAVVFLIIFLLVHRMVMKHMVEGVYSLNGSLQAITGGDLGEKADFRESLEFDELSDGINHMVSRLKGLIKEAEKKINEELAMAAEIQVSFLPREFPAFSDREEFELFASMVPAKEVGGDFYDFFLLDEDHLALVMADVSGKGIPAAMFMVMAKDKLRHSVKKHGTNVSEAVREANEELCRENEARLFVTIWVGVLTISTGHVDYVDAGHDYPAIYRAGQEFTIDKDVHCAMAGIMSGVEFPSGSFELHAGDVLYLYTDGVTEATDATDEMFRIERMLDVLNQNPDAPVEKIDAAVRAAIADFVKDAPQFDDMTMLVFRYKG